MVVLKLCMCLSNALTIELLLTEARHPWVYPGAVQSFSRGLQLYSSEGSCCWGQQARYPLWVVLGRPVSAPGPAS